MLLAVLKSSYYHRQDKEWKISKRAQGRVESSLLICLLHKITAWCLNSLWHITNLQMTLCFFFFNKKCDLFFRVSFQAVKLLLDEFELICVPVLPGFVQMLAMKEKHMRQRKPHRLSLRHPAPILRPNPMSSHSACSSREFCMTCAAPRDKGRMGCWCPHGEAGGVGGLQGGGRERVESWGLVLGKGAERAHTKASICMCGGISSSTTSPALGHWPLCRIHIKNSSSVKMTPRD